MLEDDFRFLRKYEKSLFFSKKNILFENEEKNKLGKVFFRLKSNVVTITDFLQFGQCTLVSF